MEFKFFGRSLFEVKKSKVGAVIQLATEEGRKSKFLPDFYNGFENDSLSGFISFNDAVVPQGAVGPDGKIAKEAPKKPSAPKEKLTPKGVYDLRLLHDKAYRLNTDPAYVDGQLEAFKDKLALIKSEEYDMSRGVKEIGSIVMRLENRKKYPEVYEFFEDYPYTTTAKMEDLVKEHDHLKIGQVAQFLADMPKEAADAMKAYNKATAAVCGKQAVFYIIADKKDFEKTHKRRDPILIAQSPFGHVWQILGAWDKEMLLVEEL